MTKPIKDYTADELSAKIKAIKDERERTENALKRYEKELERRKQEVLLGIPLESSQYCEILGTYYFGFSSNEAKKVFDGRLKDFVEALQKLAKGEPIGIKTFCPLLPKGWVAMSQSKRWLWFENKPYISVMDMWSSCIEKDGHKTFIHGELICPFGIKPAEDWRKSLMECGL